MAKENCDSRPSFISQGGGYGIYGGKKRGNWDPADRKACFLAVSLVLPAPGRLGDSGWPLSMETNSWTHFLGADLCC